MNERVPFRELPGIAACLIAVLLAHATTLPVWLLGLIAFCLGLRIILGARGRDTPPRMILMSIAGISIALLFVKFRTFNGLAAGSALLALTAGLKFLETKTRRDVYIVVLVIYFLGLAGLLQSESFWLLAYLMVQAWATSLMLLRSTTQAPAPSVARTLRYGLRLAAQAIPLALIFWLLFPRFSTPLWHLPGSGGAAVTGLTDSMSPGDITSLAQSEEIAFRVHFSTAAPSPREQYWRGPVLHDFDGRTWHRRSYQPQFEGPPPAAAGTAYRYTINLEPHEHNWVYALDWPNQYQLERGGLTTDYTLFQPFSVDHPIDVKIVSYSQLPTGQTLGELERPRDTHLPAGNPRTKALADKLRSEHADDWQLVLAVLSMFSREQFYYTLTPPALGTDSVDDFLFNTRRGFCGHYASAFAVIMRAAHVPTRVVTGYQGGTYNRFADYWIVRQSEAHAWDEVFIEGRGWVRVDPTAMIPPSRVEQSLDDAVTADEPLASHWQHRSGWLHDAWLRLDELSELWREQILTFNQDSQEKLMRLLHIPEPDGQKLVLVLAGMLTLALAWLTWQVRRELDPSPKDPTLRVYLRLCAKLARAGLPRSPSEGSLDYASRIAKSRPDLAADALALLKIYTMLRYARPGSVKLAEFDSRVRAFHPKRVPR